MAEHDGGGDWMGFIRWLEVGLVACRGAFTDDWTRGREREGVGRRSEGVLALPF